jgi:hypothetical protein
MMRGETTVMIKCEAPPLQNKKLEVGRTSTTTTRRRKRSVACVRKEGGDGGALKVVGARPGDTIFFYYFNSIMSNSVRSPGQEEPL